MKICPMNKLIKRFKQHVVIDALIEWRALKDIVFIASIGGTFSTIS
jgi:hypothetical protein